MRTNKVAIGSPPRIAPIKGRPATMAQTADTRSAAPPSTVKARMRLSLAAARGVLFGALAMQSTTSVKDAKAPAQAVRVASMFSIKRVPGTK